MSTLIQWLVVALLMTWSLVFMLRRFVPAALLTALSRRAGALGWAGLAARLQPVAKAGCDNGCSSCGPSCDSHADAPPALPAVQPVQWRPPASHH